MKKPPEQTSPSESQDDPAVASATPAAALPHRRQDRSDGDAPRRQLVNRGGRDDLTVAIPLLVRFKNLRQAGIVSSWRELIHLIDTQRFPPGFMLSPNVRCWYAGEVEDWLRQRPSQRKILPAAQRPKLTEARSSNSSG